MNAVESFQAELDFDSQFLKKLEYLNIVARKMLSGIIRADRQSPRKGASAEFADYRPYVAGDDFRHVDWHLYGRLEELFLKLYREEENLHLTVLLDTSVSMNWGRVNKLGYGIQVAAALAYIGMANFDSVNVLPFGPALGEGTWRLKGKSKIFRLLEFLRELRPEGETDLLRTGREFISRERRRGIVTLISDFYDLEGIEGGLRYLKYPKNEIYVIRTVDESERNPDVRGDLRLCDSETGAFREINVTDGLLKRYRQAFDSLGNRVERFCIRHEMGFVEARTEIPFDQLVLMILRRGGLVG